jgi:hypothetical protein
MASDSKITQDEMIAMFGDSMPMEAVKLLHEAPDDMTLAEMRAKLREIAGHPLARKRINEIRLMVTGQDYPDGAPIEVQRFAMGIEKLLCVALGKTWDPSGKLSIAVLCEEIAKASVAAEEAVKPTGKTPWSPWLGGQDTGDASAADDPTPHAEFAANSALGIAAELEALVGAAMADVPNAPEASELDKKFHLGRAHGLATAAGVARRVATEILTGKAPAAGAPAVIADRITWTEPAPPKDGESMYDHVFGTIGPLKFSIEWKSWKKYDSYGLEVDVGESWIGSFGSLDEAKTEAGKWIASLDPAATEKTVAQIELDKLLEFFNGDGFNKFGRDGDHAMWTPAETAIDAMRRLAKSEMEVFINNIVFAPSRADTNMIAAGQAVVWKGGARPGPVTVQVTSSTFDEIYRAMIGARPKYDIPKESR